MLILNLFPNNMYVYEGLNINNYKTMYSNFNHSRHSVSRNKTTQLAKLTYYNNEFRCN